MGVIGTYCQVCGLPVQHDHYVATEKENFFQIYRASNKPEGHFEFQSEHDWLLKGVAVWNDEVLTGLCEDGVLGESSERDGLFVGEGDDDYFAFHAYCWEAAGRPSDRDAMSLYRRSKAWQDVNAYQAQLFDFFKCANDGNSWMLRDPKGRSGSRSKARISAILETPLS